MSELLSQENFDQLKQIQVEEYENFLQDLREDTRSGEVPNIFSPEFTNQFSQAIESAALNTYSPLKFYWLQLIDRIIYLVQLHIDHQDHIGGDEIDQIEEEIFSFWEESEYAQDFFEEQKKEREIWQCSLNLLPVLENQILSFFVFHIDHSVLNDKIFLYRALPELGDSPKFLYQGDQHLAYVLDNPITNFPLVAIESKNSKLNIKDGKEARNYSAKVDQAVEIQTALYLVPQCKQGLKNTPKFKTDILQALDIIQTHSPVCYAAFTSFTTAIVPVNEPGVVSYSMQSLPGYSCINMFERDFVDLMDDLIHENGHHFLNYYLNSEEIINEDDEKIYYSPWRRSLRPIRGIYHAYCTFFWAYQLFNDLAAKELDFSEQELAKINTRVWEEYHMLEFCHDLIEDAFEKGKVTSQGMAIFKSFKKKLQKPATAVIEQQKIRELTDLLEQKKKEYSL